MKYFIFFLSFITYSANGQINSKEIANSIHEYKKLFFENKFEKLSEFASPKLIEYLSSKEDLVFLLNETNKALESKGAKIIDISFGEISKIYNEGEELQCSVPLEVVLENDKIIGYVYSSLALISFDKGKKWYFAFKVEDDDLENNKVLGLNQNIILPAKTQKAVSK